MLLMTTRNSHFFLFFNSGKTKQGTSQMQYPEMLYGNKALKSWKFYIENTFYKVK